MGERQSIITKLEKGRAEFAYKCVEEVLNKDKKTKKEYRSYIRKIPHMILSNGLGQTLAFVYAKKEDAYNLIYTQLTQYLKSDIPARIKMAHDNKDLLEWVISCNSEAYRYITQEVLAFLSWLKRFAEGMIEGE